MTMPNPYVRPTTWEDCLYLADRLRPADKAELGALLIDPVLALVATKSLSITSLTMVDEDGTPAGVLNVGRRADDEWDGWARIGMFGTPLIEQRRMTFLRHSRQTLKYLFESTGFEVFYNYVHANNDLHISWLQWLGFSFLRPVILGPFEEQFYEFAGTKGSIR